MINRLDWKNKTKKRKEKKDKLAPKFLKNKSLRTLYFIN